MFHILQVVFSMTIYLNSHFLANKFQFFNFLGAYAPIYPHNYFKDKIIRDDLMRSKTQKKEYIAAANKLNSTKSAPEFNFL